MLVDRSIVISLRRRPDRRAAFFSGLPDPWPFAPVAVLSATDGAGLDRPGWMSSAGAWGCAQSHVRALRSAISAGVETLLVMEDDAVFVPDFASRWQTFAQEVPNDWHMIMLGGEHVRAPRPINAQVVQCIDTHRTHAYLVRRAAFPQLEGMWQRARSHIDALLPFFQLRFPTYAPVEFLASQAPGISDVPKFK